MRPTQGQDRAGHTYIEFPFGDTEHLRVTHLPESYDGCERFRIQIRAANDKLRRGPEVTYRELADLLWAAGRLRSL